MDRLIAVVHSMRAGKRKDHGSVRRVAAEALIVVLAPALFGQTMVSNAGATTPEASTGTLSAAADPYGEGAAYAIGNEDVLAVNVWKEPDLSRTVTVRSDGKISLPLLGEMQAAGRTPDDLTQEIGSKLRNYLVEPRVIVIVEQVNSRKYSIVGEVARPGSYPLAPGVTVIDAIAAAGGFRDFARKKSISILRRNADGIETRIHFNYQDVVKGKSSARDVKLEPHDTVIVP